MTAAPKVPISQKILNATASLSKGTTKYVSRKKVAALCGFPKQESRSYLNQISILKKKKNFIVLDGKDFIGLTEEGLQNAEQVAPVTSNRESLDAAKAKIESAKGKRIFEIAEDGQTHTYAEIGRLIQSDHTKRSFLNLLGPLKNKHTCIEYVTTETGEKAIRMVDDMFPFGRPGEEAPVGSETES